MSVPRNVPVPSYSSSPSKSSLRRTSGSHNPSSRSLLPSPHFDEPRDNSPHESPRPDESASVIEQSQQSTHDGSLTQRPPQRNFQPFFTLIEDSTTHQHFHPTVHYIFADDDADIITEAALRSLEQNQSEPEDSQSQSQSQPSAAQAHTQQTEENTPDNRYLPRPKVGVREHYIVLDVEPGTAQNPGPAASGEPLSQPGASIGSNIQQAQQPQSQSQSQVGFEVVNAYSMSADWQVLRTEIGKAPTMAEGEGGDEEGLMLRIEGRSGTPPEGVGRGEGETVEEMIERFERGLDGIRTMLEVGRRGEAEAAES